MSNRNYSLVGPYIRQDYFKPLFNSDQQLELLSSHLTTSLLSCTMRRKPFLPFVLTTRFLEQLLAPIVQRCSVFATTVGSQITG